MESRKSDKRVCSREQPKNNTQKKFSPELLGCWLMVASWLQRDLVEQLHTEPGCKLHNEIAAITQPERESKVNYDFCLVFISAEREWKREITDEKFTIFLSYGSTLDFCVQERAWARVERLRTFKVVSRTCKQGFEGGWELVSMLECEIVSRNSGKHFRTSFSLECNLIEIKKERNITSTMLDAALVMKPANFLTLYNN